MPNRATYIPAVPSQFFTNSGVVASGYKLFTYAEGTTTKVTTYTDSDATAANTNPITLDSAGRATVFCDPTLGTSLKFVLATPTTADPPAGGDIIWTRDGVSVLPNADSNIDIMGIAAENLVAGSVVIMNTLGTWSLSDPSARLSSIDAPKIGVVITGGAIAQAIVVRVQGFSDDFAGIVAGATYYLSATPGELTTVAPVGNNHQVPFAYGQTDGSILFPVQATARVGTRIALKSIAFSVGQGNDATTNNTELTSYAVPIPAGILDEPGAYLVVEGVCSVANNANTGDLKLQLDAGTLVTVFSTAAAVANHIVPFRMKIFRRTNTTGSYNGLAHVGAGSGGAPSTYLSNAGTSACNWDAGQTLKVYAHSGTAADANKVVLTDYNVHVIRSYQGASV